MQGTRRQNGFNVHPHSQENIDGWLDSLELPRDASRADVADKMGWSRDHMRELFAGAGC